MIAKVPSIEFVPESMAAPIAVLAEAATEVESAATSAPPGPLTGALQI